MIRRHLTPAVILFFCLLCAIFLTRLPDPAGGALSGFGRAAVPAALAVVVSAVGIVLSFAGPAAIRRTGVLVLAASFGFCAGAFSLARMNVSRLRAWLPSAGQEITAFSGTLRQDSMLSRSGDTVLRVRLQSAEAGKRDLSGSARADVLVLCAGDHRLAMGERIVVHAALRPFQGDGSESFIARVKRDRIDTRGFAGRAWELRAEARAWAGRMLSRTGYPASALLEALVTGSREEVPAELAESFRRTGTLHVLALSGLHVGIVYGLAFGILGFLPRRALRIAAASLVLVAYQLFAGFMPSLERATIMLLAGSIAGLLDRDSEPINLLAASGIVVLAIDPFQAFSVSFQLSYLALAGILVLGPLVRRPLEGRVPPVLLVPLAASIGAQLATLPVVLPAFGAWYPSGIIASIVLVPLVTVFLALGLGWLLLSPLLQGPLQDLCVSVFDLLYTLIDGSASLLGRLPGIDVSPASAPAWAAAVGAVVFAAGVLLPRRTAWRPT